MLNVFRSVIVILISVALIWLITYIQTFLVTEIDINQSPLGFFGSIAFAPMFSLMIGLGALLFISESIKKNK
ncbi:hypothetical protein ACWU37_21950 (plasmid) [Photobacterium damselae subsp. damselae]